MNEFNESADSNASEIAESTAQTNYDLVCLSHLRWDFVFQRPQHLLSRFAKERRVFFIEEPVFSDEEQNYLDISTREGGNLFVVVPHLSHNTAQTQQVDPLSRICSTTFSNNIVFMISFCGITRRWQCLFPNI
jgi:ribonuclease BN (tRNA processing enzyme)